MTKSELARIAEWAFINKRLNSDADIMLLGFRVFSSLSFGRPMCESQVARGVAALFNDLKIISKKLNYGGRSPDSIPAQRIVILRQWIQNGQFSQLAA